VIERAAPQYILASMVEIAWIILIQRLGLQLGQQVVMKHGRLGELHVALGDHSEGIRQRHMLRSSLY
jgi:hypothetical protein